MPRRTSSLLRPSAAEYDDGLIACSDDGLVIRRYGAFLRPKRVPFAKVRAARRVALGSFSFSRWRIWGTTDFRHWFNFDRHRPSKRVGFALDLGTWVEPVITPDDRERFHAVLRQHGVPVSDS